MEKLEQNIAELKKANLELKKDIDKKEKLEIMRTDFLSNVSREFKTPIALIQGYAEGLKEGITDDPESMEFYCDVIMDEANKMNIMVKRLLTLNQIEFGNDEPEMERFNINELIASVVDANAIRAGQKNMIWYLITAMNRILYGLMNIRQKKYLLTIYLMHSITVMESALLK